MREETETLKKKIRDCEAQRRKRMILVKELRIVHDNAQKGIFADEEPPKSASEPVQNVSIPAAVVTPDRTMRSTTSTEPAEKACTTNNTRTGAGADPNVVAQAKANTASRNQVANPCRYARTGIFAPNIDATNVFFVVTFVAI